jgi:GNAT superfamily N-acetyltransferase
VNFTTEGFWNGILSGIKCLTFKRGIQWPLTLVEIKFLADYPELASLLSGWFFGEWGEENPALTLESIEKAVRQRMSRDRTPLCLVAILDNQPIASATLKFREVESHPQYKHWLGNVYVLPEYRRRGIGSLVIQKAIDEAKRIGIRNLYLYTRDQENLYERLGWKIIEQVEHHGRTASIMRKELE